MSSVVFLLAFCSLIASAEKEPQQAEPDVNKACREDGIPSECIEIIAKILESSHHTTLENTTVCPTITSETIPYSFFNFVRLSCRSDKTTLTSAHIPVTWINSIFVFREETLYDFLSHRFKRHPREEDIFASYIVAMIRNSSGSAEERVANVYDLLQSEENAWTVYTKLIVIMKTLVDEVARRSALFSHESRLVIKQVNEVLNNPNYTGEEVLNKIAPLLAPENRGQELTDLAKSMEIWANEQDAWLFAPEREQGTNSDESSEVRHVATIIDRFLMESDATEACREDGIPSECMDIIENILNSLQNTTPEKTTNCPALTSETISYSFFNFVKLSFRFCNRKTIIHIPVTLINSIFVLHNDTLNDFHGRLFETYEYFNAHVMVDFLRTSSGSAEQRVANAYNFVLMRAANAHNSVLTSPEEVYGWTAYAKVMRIMKTLVDEVAKRSAWLSKESGLIIKQVHEVLNNPNYTGAEIQNKIARLLAPENRGQELTDLAKSMETWACQRDTWLFAPEIEVLPAGYNAPFYNLKRLHGPHKNE